MDFKGRVVIPSFLRKNLGLNNSSIIKIRYNLKYNFVLLFLERRIYGQNSVIGNIEDCGSSVLGSSPSSGPKGFIESKQRIKGVII
ncbi:MAG: hypothetical protein ISS36_03390 [Candidatus Aenigmarchaeota archaeon]|nr:hypothetical protein [Candidatus Aenigmarchaeota archaeon]